MNGTGSGRFDPDVSASRAMIVTMLWRMEGEPEANGRLDFTDVEPDSWYAPAVCWSVSRGIASGYSETAFGPNDSVTREQLVTILHRFAQYKGADVNIGEGTNILSYSDAATVSAFAVPAMQWAAGSGLVSGRTSETLNPKDTATRAEIATIIMRYCEMAAEI